VTRNTNTIEASHGRWAEILPALDLPMSILDGKAQPCPLCGGRDRFTYDDRHGDGDYICRQCGAGKGINLIAKFRGWDFAEACKRVDEIIGNLPKDAPAKKPARKIDHKAACNRLWASGRPVEKNDPVALYFEMRGGLNWIDPDLRYVPAMYHKDPRTGARSEHHGMIAMVRDVNGTPTTIHRTFLTADGRKANVDPCRKLMPGPFPKGAAVRLGGVAETIGVAEGIETARAASLIYRIPVWPAINEVGLQAWQPPAGVKRVIVFGDNDPNFVGQSAAFMLARHLSTDDLKKRDLTVEVRIPSKTGDDWNDVWLVMRSEARAFCHGLTMLRGEGVNARAA